MDISDPTIERLTTSIVSLADIAVLWLYGSRARGDFGADSDYDLAVAFEHFKSDRTEARLRPELLAMDLAAKLDMPPERLSVVDINLAPVPLAVNIVTEGITLLVNDSLRLAREENRISSMWELDHEYHLREFG